MNLGPIFLGAAVLLTPLSQAQNANAPDQARKDGAQDLAAERAGVENANGLAKAGNLAQAEMVLTGLNRSKSGSAEWHLETAQRLMLTAEQLAREGEPANVAALSNQALEQLTLAEKKATDVDGRAAAKALAGFIYERYLADLDRARASYEAAAQLVPDKGGQAKEAAERLKRTDDNLKVRAKAGNK